MSPARLARVEAVAEREIDALLAQPDFQELLTALAEMEELPEEERLRRLERLAWHVLELALADGDWRAAAFIADQMRRGCHPARSLAKAVIAAQARAAAPPPTEPKPTRRPRSAPTTPSTPPWVAPPRACARSSASRRRSAHLPESKAAEPSDAPAASEPAQATAPSERPARPRRPIPRPPGSVPAPQPAPPMPPTTTRAAYCGRGRRDRRQKDLPQRWLSVRSRRGRVTCGQWRRGDRNGSGMRPEGNGVTKEMGSATVLVCQAGRCPSRGPCLSMALRMTRSLRMAAVSASFLGLPAPSRRW